MSDDRQGGQESFLARWSRRKDLSRRGEEVSEPDAEPDDENPQPAAGAPESPAAAGEESTGQPPEGADTQAEPVAELPSLESLGEDSDYSAFLRDGVPADMKQKALRKLFHSPKFNVRDGLDDYDLDFSNPEPLGDVITAEMRYRIERELERLARLDDEETAAEATAIAAADAGEQDAPDDEVHSEADDDRSEPS